jgi:hypothetical protein
MRSALSGSGPRTDRRAAAEASIEGHFFTRWELLPRFSYTWRNDSLPANLSSQSIALLRLGIAYFGVHTLLFIYDVFTPDAFLRADRALTRMDKVLSLVNDSEHFWTNLIANGDPGDYIYQVVPYAIADQYGVIIFQILPIHEAFATLLADAGMTDPSSKVAISFIPLRT